MTTRILDRIISPAARNRIWRLLEEPERARFRRALGAITVAPSKNEPALSYGNVAVPDKAGLISGGRVKLLHLAGEFPERADFNLLYLVSSAPPRFAADLVAWAQQRGAKFVWNQNGVAYPAWYGSRVTEINAPMRALRDRADYIFYQSDYCRASANYFLGESSTAGEIAYNSVDLDLFQPNVPPATEPWRLLAAGSHQESYRVLSVLDTLSELRNRGRNVRLGLAGRFLWPGAEQEVNGYIRKLRLEAIVDRIPPYRQDEAPGIYQSAHILIHPKYKDPCPTVPIEAMACGVPVIGSASGGMPELVREGAGELLPVPDSWEENHWPAASSFADAVEKVMASWTSYSAAARANAAARFSAAAWVEQHRRVFSQLISA